MFSLTRRVFHTKSNSIIAKSLFNKHCCNYATIKYTKDHEWVRYDTNKNVSVGISDEAQKKLGEIVHMEFNVKVGDSIKTHDVIGEVESVKSVSEVYSPVSGKIIEINKELSDNPGKINESAESDAWMIKVDLESESEELMDKDSYVKYCESEEH
ncbi:hypothetical protein ABK040_004199 [Willaertia magna]